MPGSSVWGRWNVFSGARSIVIGCCSIGVLVSNPGVGEDIVPKFLRGDINEDGIRTVGDIVPLLRALFIASSRDVLPCEDAADVDDDGRLTISDAISLLFYLYGGELSVAEPLAACGPDVGEDALGCASYAPCGNPPIKTNSMGITLVYVRSGSFMMGSPETELGRDFYPGRMKADETQHKVTISCGFYISNTEITQEAYLKVTGRNPSAFNKVTNGIDYGVNLKRPVDSVTWEDANRFCRLMGVMDSRRYRLPTEAEWEYCCRAGTGTRFWFGDALECDIGPLTCKLCQEIERFLRYCVGVTGSVASKEANEWGLYDMSGSVSEWCEDWFGPYPREEVTDPTGSPKGTHRVFRGLGFERLWAERSACRGYGEPNSAGVNNGFRIVESVCKTGLTP